MEFEQDKTSEELFALTANDVRRIRRLLDSETAERERIKAGAIVRMKSGGPLMTVEKAEGDGVFLLLTGKAVCIGPKHVACVWFVGDVLYKDVFQLDALIEVR